MDISHSAAEVPAVADDHYFRLLAENMSDLICLHALDGTYLYVTSSCERLLGYSPAELTGTSPYAIFHPDDIPHIKQEDHHQSLHGESKTRTVYRIRTKDGEYVWFETLTQPIRDAQGKIIQLQTASRDVTERVQSEKTHRESAERLRLALRTARLRNWEWNIQNDEIFYADDQGPVAWLPPGQHRPNFAAFLAAVHPDDRRRVTEAVRRTLEEGTEYEVEFRLLRDGIVRWVVNTGQVYRDESGRPFQMLGMAQDITERKQAELAVRQTALRMETLIANMQAGVLVEDEHQQVMLANQRFCTLLCLPVVPEALIGENYAAILRQAETLFHDLDSLMERTREILESRHLVIAEQFTLTNGRVLERDYVPIRFAEEHYGHLWLYHDITERKHAEEQIQRYNALLEVRTAELEQANSQLAELATLDGLTGLKNHRAFQERLADECRRAARHRTALSLLLMDVDWFKAFNDAFGHPAGDGVLYTVGKILRETVRETDFVARYGGEEFAVILPQTDHEAAGAMAERLRAAIEGAEWDKRPITASFGVSSLIAESAATDRLIASADKALYQSKTKGRNQVTLSPKGLS